jgi:hypothetical protein
MADKKSLVVAGSIETRILTIRGQKAMLDADLAELYGVETKRLNEQVRRNTPPHWPAQEQASHLRVTRQYET